MSSSMDIFGGYIRWLAGVMLCELCGVCRWFGLSDEEELRRTDHGFEETTPFFKCGGVYMGRLYTCVSLVEEGNKYKI